MSSPIFRLLFCAAFLLLLKNETTAQAKIRAIQTVDSIPALNNDGKIATYLHDSIQIYFCEDLVLYRLSAAEDSVVRKNDEFEVYDGKTFFYWFVHQKDSSYGYSFDENRPRFKRWASRDSTVHGSGLVKFQFDVSEKGELRRLYSVTDPNTGNLKEAYMDKDSVKNNRDTIYFAFSGRMKDIPFSLDKGLDKYKGMKLIDLKIISGEQYLPDYKITLPRRVTTVRMEEIPVDNTGEILKYVSLFRALGKRI